MIFPGGIDDLQQQITLHPPHFRMVIIFDGTDHLLFEFGAIQPGDLVSRQIAVNRSCSQAESDSKRTVAPATKPANWPFGASRNNLLDSLLCASMACVGFCLLRGTLFDEQLANFVALFVTESFDIDRPAETAAGPFDQRFAIESGVGVGAR